jgi:hypothetical protein
MLENLNPRTPRHQVDQADGTFLSLTDPDRMTFLCLIGCQTKTRREFSFLDELKGKWKARYGNSAVAFRANSKDAEFGNIEMAALVKRYNAPPAVTRADTMARIMANLGGGSLPIAAEPSLPSMEGSNLLDHGDAPERRCCCCCTRRLW